MSERPRISCPRILRDWLNPAGAREVHSLVDKVYKPKNLMLAWEKVRRNKGAGGVDGVTWMDFEEGLQERLDGRHVELKAGTCRPQPARQKLIPKAGQPGKYRPLGIPAIYGRVCQQALRNRLEPIFEALFDDANFGYRRGRSAKDAMGKIWPERRAGSEWGVDADLKNFFGTVDHDKLITLVAQRVSDGRVLRLIRPMLEAGCMADGVYRPTTEGTPQGGIVSPLLSNILLTPFDREMRARGYRVMRYADDWVVTCRTRREAEEALAEAKKILSELGVVLNEQKTRIVHVSQGFEFLGYKVKRGHRTLQLSAHKISSGAQNYSLYVYPTQKALDRFKEQIRKRTRRKAGISVQQLIDDLNPVIHGWGHYYCKAHVRKLFNRLARWIVQRIWSYRFKRWRCQGYRELPERKLYGEMGLVNLVHPIPSLARR